MHADDRQNAEAPDCGAAAEPVEQLEYGVVRVMRNKTSIMVTVPKVWARTLHWEAGDYVRHELHDGNILLINLDAPARIARLRRSQGGEDGTPTAD